MINLADYSEKKLKTLKAAIDLELFQREFISFPYKEGDCFVSISSNSVAQTILICKIENTKSKIETTTLSVDSGGNVTKFINFFTYSQFVKQWKHKISPEIFLLYEENKKMLNNIKKDFIKQIFELKDLTNERKNNTRTSKKCNL